jgi:hypothetical protein
MTAVAEAPAKKAAKKELFDLSSIAPVVKPRRVQDSFSMLLYGAPKAGKTLLAATASDVDELSPVLVLAIEDGTSVLAHQYEDVDVIEVEDYATGSAIIQAVAEGNTKYKTIIIDTVGEYQEFLKEVLIGAADNSTGGMRIQDWGTLKEKSVNAVKLLHRSPVNSIFISHAERVKDEESGKVTIQPYMLGKGSLGEIPKVVDIIAYLAVVQDKESGGNIRVLQTESNGKIDAGDRFGKLDAQIINPTMGVIYAQLSA